MGVETVVGYVVALSVPVWLVIEQVASWMAARESAPALNRGQRAVAPAPARTAAASQALSGKAA